jgi:Protein of unknown function (DUF3485)
VEKVCSFGVIHFFRRRRERRPDFDDHSDCENGLSQIGGGDLSRIFWFYFVPGRFGSNASLSQAVEPAIQSIDSSTSAGTGYASMNIQRLVFLQLMLFAGLGSAYLIPTQSNQPMGVIMDLPESLGQWWGVTEKVTEAELNGLAPDTSFARRIYSNAFGDQIDASIVLAGEDPDNSLHRPERCLPAQGWIIVDSRTVTMRAPTLPAGQLTATRLHNWRKLEDNKGNVHTVYNLNYYWFVGYKDITPSHIERFLIDVRDRVTKGYNQRWAYVTVAATVTEGLTKFGRSEKATDEMIQSFIVQLFPQIIGPTVRKANETTAIATSGS